MECRSFLCHPASMGARPLTPYLVNLLPDSCTRLQYTCPCWSSELDPIVTVSSFSAGSLPGRLSPSSPLPVRHPPTSRQSTRHISPPAPSGCRDARRSRSGRTTVSSAFDPGREQHQFHEPFALLGGLFSTLEYTLEALHLVVLLSCWNPIRMVLPSGQAFPCQLLAHPLMESSSLVVTPLGKVDFSPSNPCLW